MDIINALTVVLSIDVYYVCTRMEYSIYNINPVTFLVVCVSQCLINV
jgi:hypothetical protein